ncbi:unnamed protein product [Leptidea sinapis]|uniref:apyrase n=1 Tax=Leptidea sinapis TaxID=189913 RepID=A0A5E4PUL2_9NEOP|nr:unnamed protein product [Leptidea sinapis]
MAGEMMIIEMRSCAWLVLVIGIVLAQNDDLFELNIIHYNDFHAHFDEISVSGGTCNPDTEDCIGGISRLYTAIRQVLEAEPDSLVLNGGDTFQGTVWYNFLRWNVTQYFMNILPKHDAHVLGNHEFDHGVEGLVPYLQHLQAPMLGANVNATLEPELAPLIQNHITVTRNNRTIGIIGILLRTFSAPIGRVIMEDELEAVNREAAILAEQNVDIIIVLSHILVVQASCYTRYLGNIKLYFNDQGKIEHWEGQPIYLGTSIVKDPRIEELLNPWRDILYPISREVLGRSLALLNRSWCFRGECNLGSWVCDAFLEQT